MAIDPARVRARLDDVVAALRASGAWDVEQPSDDQLFDAGPFGMRKLAFEQWLRYVFVPNVERMLESSGPWPDESSVAAHATREWDGHPNADEMLRALRAFDALFAPSAAQLYDDSRAAFARGERDEALALVRAALAVDPRYPNAHNHAGWILLRSPRTAADLDEAIVHFLAARELAPEDDVPLANHCDALVGAGRRADAIAEAERATTGSCAAGAHNWLGCQDIGQPGLDDRAIAHFRAATKRRPWGLAHLNLGKALENADREDEAYEQFATALQCTDAVDRAYCHERIASFQARRGWLRNALDNLRAAVREDDKTSGPRRALHVEGLVWVEQQLRAAGIEPGRERTAAWRRACELEIPPGFLARNELGELLADDVIEVERLVRAERWADLVVQLEKLRATDHNKLFDAVGYAEAGADRAHAAGANTEAVAIMKLVVEAYRAYASGASSGAEGMARMVDVNRVSAKLAAWTVPTVVREVPEDHR